MSRKPFAGVFMTATDTGVGKTYIGSQLVNALHRRNLPVVPRKPVESGCEMQSGKLRPADATAYYLAIDKKIPLDQICRYRYAAAVSPARAARLQNETLTIQMLVSACCEQLPNKAFLSVEGAGGFYSPITSDGLNAHLAEQLQLPAIVVAPDRLGCINHVLMTLHAARAHQVQIRAVILNQCSPQQIEDMDNASDLANLINVPIFKISYDEKLESNSQKLDQLIQLVYET